MIEYAIISISYANVSTDSGFYPNGFARIFRSFSEQELDKQKDVEEEGIDFPKLVGRIWIDVVWGTVFWLGIIPSTFSLIFS